MSLGIRTQSSRVRTQKLINCMLILYVDPKAIVIAQSAVLGTKVTIYGCTYTCRSTRTYLHIRLCVHRYVTRCTHMPVWKIV